MIKKLLLVTLLTISCDKFCSAMEPVISKSSPLIDTIPGDYARMVNKVSKQPLITTDVSPYKALPTTELKVSICCVLSRAAVKYYEKASMISGWIPSPSFCCFYESCVRVYGDKEINYEELKTAYEKVIFELKHGWCLSTLKENPEISVSEPEKDYFLFIKKSYLNEEDLLIRLLAGDFGLNKIRCGVINSKIYLLVEKKYFKKVQEIFGFDLFQLTEKK